MSDRNFISINKTAAGRTRMMLGQRKTDRLAPDQRERLEAMVKEIDENMDALLQERDQHLKSDGKSQASNLLSKVPGEPNLFSMEEETKERLSKIDSKLRQRNPAAQEVATVDSALASGFKLPMDPMSDKKSKMQNTSSNFSNMDAMS